jgi:hypothetical protein
MEKFIEESAVVDHGCAQFFGGRLVSCGALTYSIRGTIGFDESSMVNRNIGDALIEARFRESPRVQNGVNQFIGFSDSTSWTINEVGLYCFPISDVARALGIGEIANLEMPNAFNAGEKSCFGLAAVAIFFNCLIVLRSKAVSQLHGRHLVLSHSEDESDHDDEDHRDQTNQYGRASAASHADRLLLSVV